MFEVESSFSEDYVPNNLNQYSEVAGTSFTYDANGNLVSDGVNTYTYDVESRLISATTPTQTASYTYDPFGGRTSKTVDGTVTRYILDGPNVLVEYDGTGGEFTKRYIHGAGIDQPIHVIVRNGASYGAYYYHFDALGSVVALSTTSGALAEGYAYSPFGVSTQANLAATPYLYTGREYDPETGLYYYRNRYYDPFLGRFLQPDPIGYLGGMNLYEYVGGNPTNWVDPLGLFQSQSSGATWGETLGMFGDWVTGTGPSSRSFGPNSGQVADMQGAPGANALRELFHAKNEGNFFSDPAYFEPGVSRPGNGTPLEGVTNFGGRFGAAEVLEAGFNPTRQFVGRYSAELTVGADGSDVHILLRNTTSMESFLYGVGPEWERSSFGPGGNMRQTYFWSE